MIFELNELNFDNYKEIASDISNDLKEKFQKAADHCKEQHENPKQGEARINTFSFFFVFFCFILLFFAMIIMESIFEI